MGLKKGTRLQNRYVIDEILGRGGEGEVYKAVDEHFMGQLVAIKETYYDDDESRIQFQRGAAILRRLHHGNLPKVYDHFSETDSHFLVMDYIEGDDLSSVLKNRKVPFSSEQVRDWATTLLKTLKYLHSQSPKVIHRDIKPQNIKLTAKGRLYLLDFGLAKQSTISRTGASVRGYSLNYASLEQIQGHRTDERSDLYALGATLYHLLSGEVPVDAKVREQVIQQTKVDPMRNKIKRLPAPYAEMIGRAMKMNPIARYETAEEMLRTLEIDKPISQPIILKGKRQDLANSTNLQIAVIFVAVVFAIGILKNTDSGKQQTSKRNNEITQLDQAATNSESSSGRKKTVNTSNNAPTENDTSLTQNTLTNQRRLPQFKNYRVLEKYKGKNAPLILSQNDRMYRTRLKLASVQRPNFAGHYILTAWGCGTTCLMGAVIDSKTGKVYWWNFTICCWENVDEKFDPIEFRPDSKLIVFSGLRNEKEGDNAAHFYKFENGEFIHLRSMPPL